MKYKYLNIVLKYITYAKVFSYIPPLTENGEINIQ